MMYLLSLSLSNIVLFSDFKFTFSLNKLAASVIQLYNVANICIHQQPFFFVAKTNFAYMPEAMPICKRRHAQRNIVSSLHYYFLFVGCRESSKIDFDEK